MKAEKRRLHVKIIIGCLTVAMLLPGCTFWKNTSYTQSSSKKISRESMQQFLTSVRVKNTGDAESHYELGRHFQRRGKYSMALKEFWEAAAIDPGRPEYYNAIGVCYDNLKEYALAIMCYRWALDLNPEFAEAHNNIGYSYYLQDKMELARSELMRAVSLDTGNKRYLNNLSLCYKHAVDKKLLLEVAIADTEEKTPSMPVEIPLENTVENDVSNEKNGAKEILQVIASDVETPREDLVADALTKAETTKKIIKPASQTLETSESRVGGAVVAVNTLGQVVPQTVPTPPLIEISNGNGVYRMATNLGRYFKAKGFNVVRLTNADHFNYPDTSITYGNGCRHSADYMAQLMLGSEYRAESMQNGHAVGKIKIVLGKDIENLNQIFAGELPVLVANGNGVNGMAARVSGFLNQKGFKLMRPINAAHFNYEETCVFYPEGRLDCAEFVGNEIPGEAEVKYAAHDSKTASIKIIIGRDLYL